MKAMVYRKYGGPEQLHPEDLPVPEPQPGEVRVRVHAASVNSWDWERLRGVPFPNRIPGLFRPAYPVLGADVAGTVAAVGEGVTAFQPGDAVVGDLSASGWGGFAEFVCTKAAALVPKPEGVSFEEAAAVPQAGCMALQGLRELGLLRAGMQVLFIGAGGGVGTYGVQLCTHGGAQATAVDRADKLPLLESLGAQRVIDYTREDFAADAGRYDLIVDVVGRRPLADIVRALAPGGRYVMVGGPLARVLQTLWLGRRIGRREHKVLQLLLATPNWNLPELLNLLAAGTLRSVIGGRYPLDGLPEALRLFGTGAVQGKLIVTP